MQLVHHLDTPSDACRGLRTTSHWLFLADSTASYAAGAVVLTQGLQLPKQQQHQQWT